MAIVTAFWAGDDGKVAKLSISLTASGCHYGGCRWWLECPCCARRVAAILMASDNWGCRHCLGVRYATQYLPRRERWLQRASDIARRLGMPSLLLSQPVKPKRMHWRTFNQVVSRMTEYTVAALLEAGEARWAETG
jgi:hypothetical protein